MFRRWSFFLVWLAIPLLCARAHAFDDRAALSGLKEAKAAFDLTEGNARALLAKLETVDETRRSLLAQGVKPRFVLTFRGGSTRLVQTDPEMIRAEDREVAARIARKLAEMGRAEGVESLEQCAVAIRLQETSAEKVLPGIRVVGNGWISLMAYQARGYAYIYP
jgi:intracellular sulfur oxidation DsrE/DsrF family protein